MLPIADNETVDNFIIHVGTILLLRSGFDTDLISASEKLLQLPSRKTESHPASTIKVNRPRVRVRARVRVRVRGIDRESSIEWTQSES